MVGGDMTDQKNANSAVTPGVPVNSSLISVKDRDSLLSGPHCPVFTTFL
jgi:hypothetical protein